MEANIQHLFKSLKKSVFKNPAETPPELRQSIREKLRSEVNTGDSEPHDSPVLNEFVEKVARNSYKVVDQDIENLRAEGFSESQIYELTIAVAWGAGVARFERGLELLNSLPA